MLDMERGDAANVFVISLGTYMEAPIHFVPGGPGIGCRSTPRSDGHG
jgi:kynurenine formamidase